MTFRVVHLLGAAGREHVGPALIVAALARALDPARFETHAWFLGADGPLADELRRTGAQVLALRLPSLATPRAAALLGAALARGRFRIVHQHVGGPTVRAVVRAATSARVVAHLHGAREGWGLDPAWVLARGADATIATSRAVAARVPWAYPTVIYPAVDPWPHPGPNPSPASPLPLGEGRVRASPGQSEEAPIVGTAARLVPIKGLDVLVRAVATLPNARLEIAGDGPERARLERLARELGTADRITFLGWQDDLAECFARWTLASVASRDEGFGIAALEAMAAGLPVVASRVGGIPELVEHERSGLLVPPGDIAALANALGELTADPQRAAAMGAAARERAAAFRPERLVAAVAAVYERLL